MRVRKNAKVRKAPTTKRLSKAAPKHLRVGLWFHNHKSGTRLASLFLAILLGFGMFFEITSLMRQDGSYELSAQASALVGAPVAAFGDGLRLDTKTQKFEYNQGYTPASEVKGQINTPRFTASFSSDPTQGMEVTDPVSQMAVTLKPKFNLDTPRKDQNRLIYPLKGKNAVKVVSLQASGLKEDIIVNKFQGETLKFEYELQLPTGLEARLESNGSLGVYGPDSSLLGNVQTGSEADAELLENARKHAKKDTLLFTLPAPFVKERNITKSSVAASFKLEGGVLTLEARKLDTASYPLSIDPSVYVETAQELMRGNNESNVDFDVSNELIQKGVLTGARIPSWTSSLALNAGRWGQGTVVAGGYIYVIGGNSGSANVSTVYWAKLNASTFAIESPNPGNGACTNWCTNSAYNLPAARSALSVVAYNGYLYAIGGKDASCVGTNAVCSTTYYAKLGANGEPISWTSTSALFAARSYAGAVAYNNRIYIAGGQTNTSLNGDQGVEFANVNPDGTLGAWSTSGMTSIPTAGRWAHSLLQYNGYIYLIGGSSTTTVQSSVQYIKINADGTLASSWVTTTAFTTARASYGGNFATIWGGYLYITGGCSAMTTTNCSTILSSSTIQLASINADGSITDWTAVTGVTQTRTGFGLVAWRNALYVVGGCGAATTTSNCASALTTTAYGVINEDGDISSVEAGSDLPAAGDGTTQGGRMSQAVVMNNGFIYNIGGCTNVAAGNTCENGGTAQMSGNTSYSSINAAGDLVLPSPCTGTTTGVWCVDSTNLLNGTTGIGAFAATVFNNVIYVYGGTTGSDWLPDMRRVSLNANGSLAGAWTTQTAASLSLGTARGYSYMFARANPAAAGTNPGNIYLIGGCRGAATTADTLSCPTGTEYYNDVVKCSITTTGALDDVGDCTETGQLQLDTNTGLAGDQGLALMAGTVLGDYIYLVGGARNIDGSADDDVQLDHVYYAKLNSSNNIVAADGSSTRWQRTTNNLPRVRRRGYAFSANGYLYAVAGHDGRAGFIDTLNDVAFAKINVATGDIGAFATSTTTVSDRWDFAGATANGYVYILGGCSVGDPPDQCTTMTGSTQRFQVHNNYSGSPAAYTSSSQFTTDRVGGSSAVYNGYLYYAGGCTNIGCTTVTDNVQFAPLNDDGSVGTWANTTDSTLPAARGYGQLEVVGGTLYYIGGQDGAGDEQPQIYYGTPSAGNVAAWSTATNGLPADRTQHSATVWNNRIYVTGGLDDSAASTTTIYASPSLSAGGDIGSAWTTTGMTAFNVARSGHVAIAYAGNLYILGGFDGTNYLADVQYAKISSTGTIGSWSYTSSLPQRIRQGDGFAANGYMYIFGGRSATSTCTNNTYTAAINANTTIASGNNPTGLGVWSQTNVKYTGDRYGVTAAYNAGRTYLMGGGCAALVTTTDKMYYSTLQSQPQIARYSYAIDTDTNVTPTKWLLNGLDNDIGARWILSYRSSTSAAATWGQATDVGAVMLGTAGTYTPLDGAGASTNAARHYYFSVSIDSSQAFGYPEDITRGPTIADLSLFFTSDPGKRLRHGKTFTGGELQPLDTPF